MKSNTMTNEDKKAMPLYFAEALALLFVFAASANLFAKYFLLTFLAFVVTLVFRGGSIEADKSAAVLIAFSFVCFAVEFWQNAEPVKALKLFVFPAAYLAGLNMFSGGRYDKAKKLTLLLVAVCAGNLLHIALNLSLGSFADIAQSRNIADFWTGEAMSATMHATLFCVSTGVCISVLCSDVKLPAKLAALFVLLFMLITDLVLACRTPVFAGIIIGIAAAIYMRGGATKKCRMTTLILLASAFALMFFLYCADAFGIKRAVLNSNLFTRLAGINGLGLKDSRLGIRLAYLPDILARPFGGSYFMQKYGYAHDLLLDLWDKYGVLPAALIAVYIIISVRRSFAVLRDAKLPFLTRQLVLCVNLSMLIEFFIEPVIYGIPWLLSTFCLVDGAVCAQEVRV